MGTVELPEDIPSVDEKYGPSFLSLGLVMVEEPEGTGQGYSIEEVRTDADEHINRTGPDEFLPDLHLGSSCISAEFAITKPARPFLFNE